MHPAAQLSTPVLYDLAPNKSSGGRYHLRERRDNWLQPRTRSARRKDGPGDDLAGHFCGLIGVLSRESEISNLERPVPGDQQVIRLHILTPAVDISRFI